ncbi:hypothetical protein P7J64_03130 [Streptococcus suis]|uniref:hypothetical protein n=1 Tax=Streptococcus suis TaxID=1307 RepID=UPI000C195AD2|nr:hypothetical protein [Streptococcus suis]
MKLNRFSFMLCILSACLLLTYLVWAKTIPFDGAPDEYLRYKIPMFIYKHGHLPTGYDTETLFDRGGNWSYGFYSQFLAPLFSALFMKVTSLFSQSDQALLLAARFTSVISGVLTANVIALSVWRITKSKMICLFTILFVGLWPQIIFLSSYVNNDIIGLLGVALVTDVVVKTSIARTWTYFDTIYLALGFIVCLLGYINTYGFVLFAGIYFLFAINYSNKLKHNSFVMKINHCVLLSIILIVVVAPFFVRNYLLYGDFFGSSAFEAAHQKWIEQGGESMLNGAVSYGRNFIEFFTWRNYDFIVWTWQSFIGRFSYMSLVLSNFLYNVYWYSLIIGVCFSLFYKFKTKLSIWEKIAYLSIAGSMLITIFLHVYRSYFTDYQPQGRYIIGLFVPLCLMMMFGYWKLLKMYPKIQRLVFLISALLLIFSSIHIFKNYIYDFYIIRGLGVIYH